MSSTLNDFQTNLKSKISFHRRKRSKVSKLSLLQPKMIVLLTTALKKNSIFKKIPTVKGDPREPIMSKTKSNIKMKEGTIRMNRTTTQKPINREKKNSMTVQKTVKIRIIIKIWLVKVEI